MLADHVQPNLLTTTPASVPTRNGYGDGLVEAATRDERVVALSADLTESTRTHLFAEKFPQRFVQVGVAEQNLASVAAGMAAMGKIPFIASYAMFSPGRNWEQIRTTVCYNNSNVKVIGAHAGVSVGPDGATHQAIEDLAIMRVIPNMVVINPADEHEARKATLAAAKYTGPVYIRLGRSATPVVTTPASPFTIGAAYQILIRDLAHTKTAGIVVTGSLLYNALKAAATLNEQGIGVSVLHVPTIKPLDTAALEAFAADHAVLVTLEEHQRSGGLGAAVAEYLSEVRPTRVVRMGINDVFGQSGEPDELLSYYGLDVPAIIATVERVAA
jgi:transketolase